MTLDKIKVTKWPTVFSPGSWKGFAKLGDASIYIISINQSRSLTIPYKEIKKYTFNSMSGMWMFKLRSGKKHYLHTNGLIFSRADPNQHLKFVSELEKRVSVKPFVL